MKFEELQLMYEEYMKKYGKNAYKHISELYREAKEIHKKDWEKKPTKGGDHEQSWKGFKGNNFEKIIAYIINSSIEYLGLKIINGKKISKSKNLPFELGKIKRNLLIDYGEYGMHLPDVDLIVYDPNSLNVICIISSKTSLRERLTQTGYWKLKLLQSDITEHIQVYFITLDEGKKLTKKTPAPKGRAIAEIDLDGSYVLTEENLEGSDKVKLFEHFIDDLEKLLKKDNRIKKLLKEKPVGPLEEHLN